MLGTELIMAAPWIAQVVIFAAGWLGPWRYRVPEGEVDVMARILPLTESTEVLAQ